jgi:hypothetical protein
MKKHLIIAIVFVSALFIAGIAKAQMQAGRFLVGTTLFNVGYSGGTTITQQDGFFDPTINTYSVQSMETHPSTLGISAGLNLWVGYFVTKNVLAGLGFNSGTTNTYTTLFRYYFNHSRPDSAKFDFFVQANISYSNSNTDHPAVTEYYQPNYSYASIATTDYHTQSSTFPLTLWFGDSFHLTKHWSLEGMIGFIFSNTVSTTGAYTQSTSYYSSFTNPNPQVDNYPTLKNTTTAYQGAVRLMLTYRI